MIGGSRPSLVDRNYHLTSKAMEPQTTQAQITKHGITYTVTLELVGNRGRFKVTWNNDRLSGELGSGWVDDGMPCVITYNPKSDPHVIPSKLELELEMLWLTRKRKQA